MMTEVLLSAVTLLLVALASIAWWGFRSVLERIDVLSGSLAAMATTLAKVEQWQAQHEQEDERRFGFLEGILTKGPRP